MDWELVEGQKKKLSNLKCNLERTWYYVLGESPVSVKYVCGWKIHFRMDKGVHKTLENFYVFGCIFLFRGCCKTPDKYIQEGAFRETALQL